MADRTGERNSFYGRHHSDETKRRLADKNRRDWHVAPCACGCGQIVNVPDHRMKRSATHLFFVDRTHWRDYLAAQRAMNWRRARYGAEWPKIATAIRERDGVCQMCGKTPEENGAALDVHHIIAYRISLDDRPENLTALCRPCHLSITRQEVIPQNPAPARTYQRVCPMCEQVFSTASPYQKICGDPVCAKARRAMWEKNHAKKIAAARTPAYERKRERIRKAQAANSEKVRQQKRESDARRRDEINTKHRAYYATNRESILARLHAQREAAKIKTEPSR
jgi:5-methylcytosine-specific restriction endonuclease McrA